MFLNGLTPMETNRDQHGWLFTPPPVLPNRCTLRVRWWKRLEKRKPGAEERKPGDEERKVGAERKAGAEERKPGAEERKPGAEEKKPGAKKRDCTLEPP